ncbi:M50 family metallopeptidase [Blastopirellula marina]|uniref:Cell division protein FtsH n=1 Tax=Blastopirellula marina DSM 3645 TaxID=314230 RepID=A3ZT75_9BACT|nr:M50 family metallopeptidase [Blastopirellula marina]EAQ80126.1 hypothetical protein DSM3645_19058 [Blastopirellula marina DSM 3645]
MDDDEETIAYHESGHAFMAVLVGARVRRLTIEPEDDDGPQRFGDAQIEWRLSQFTAKQRQEKMVLVALAGPVAEMLYSGEPYHPGHVAEWAPDWAAAWEAATPLFRDEKKRLRYLEDATRQLHSLLDAENHWAALAAIADNLAAHETLNGEQIEEIVAGWIG